jgi:hypothetical protein
MRGSEGRKIIYTILWFEKLDSCITEPVISYLKYIWRNLGI